MIDKRINYAWGGPGGKSPGTSASGGSRHTSGGGGGGGPPGGGDRQMTYTAPRPVTTAKAPPSILSKPAPTTDAKETHVSDQYTDKGITHDLGDGSVMEDVYKKPDLRTEKEKEEDWEKDQDWDLIKEMSDKGYDFDEIQSAVEKGLTTKAPTTSTRRQDLIDYGLNAVKNIVPETGLEKSLLNRMKSFAPETQTGLGSLGNYFNPGKMMTNYALNKMGLGMLNPILGLASLFGFKNPLSNIGTKFAGVPRKEQPVVGGRREDTPQNVMQASIKKFQPTESQVMQMAEIQRKRDILQSYADQKGLNEKGMNTLAQMNQLINQYQVNPANIWT